MQKEHKFNYRIIINSKIEESKLIHPWNQKSGIEFKSNIKKQIIEYSKKDLKIQNIENISKQNHNDIYRIFVNNFYYNLIIANVNGGGKDISFNIPEQKIEIPYPKIQKFINEGYQRILLMTLYMPLKNYVSENSFIDDIDNRVYLILKPNEIYNSICIPKDSEKKVNTSSRWIKLADIINVIKNKNYQFNKKKNVYIVYWSKLKEFFEIELQPQYRNIVDSNLNELEKEIDLNNISKEDLNKLISKEDSDELISKDPQYFLKNPFDKFRHLFRESLIANRGIKCEIKNCPIGLLELLVASHIKPLSEISHSKYLSNSDKKFQIIDTNNGFLLCSNHDKLFDKFIISFDDNGKLLYNNNLEDQINYIYEDIDKPVIDIKSGMEEYLIIHRNHFNKKNMKNLNNNLDI